MGRKKSVDRAKRTWWKVHVDAQRASGLTAVSYCRRQGLGYSSFLQWRVALDEREAQKSEHRRQWKRRYQPISQDKRRRATQAFWAMHVEAWTWSGLTAAEYSRTHNLSSFSLRRWRNLIEAEVFDIDWRTMLHPSALPLLGTKISPRTIEYPAQESLTSADDGVPKRAPRRTFTTEQKVAILLEADRPGETISSVSRTHDIATSVLFRWRDQLGIGGGKPALLVPVRM